MKYLFNDGWYFSEQPIREKFKLSDFNKDNVSWQTVKLPHDWLISDADNLYRNSEGWYRKKFNYIRSSVNPVTVLELDGIYMNSTIFLNGEKIFEWKNGTTAQLVPLSDYLIDGENELDIRVVYQSPNARWYTGAGIYRNVWIHYLPEVCCLPGDNYCHAEPVMKDLQDWLLKIATKLSFINKASHGVKIKYSVFNRQNEKIAESDSLLNPDSDINNVSISIHTPNLWAPENPYLYKLVTTIYTGTQYQEIIQNIGFKVTKFIPNKGLFLNGNYYKLHGVCEHECNGALGGVMSKSATIRKFEKLKEMGANAIRTAHNPFSREFIELADRFGFLIISEFSDVWRLSKTKYDYSRFFDDWHEKDVASWIKRDRSHVSVLMWSIGNEIYDTHISESARDTAKKLISLVKKHDYFSNAPITFGSNYLLWQPTQKIAELLDVVGYNYGEALYDRAHQEHPDWKIYGSETFSIASSRGIYHFPLSQNILTDDDLQCSSLGNSATSWGAKSAEDCLISDLKNKFSLGQFIWTGYDYIGEPTPYHTRSSYLGQIDTAGFPKDSYYIIKAAWTSQKKPFVHIFPYWNFNDNQLIDIRVCANTDSCELFLNGKSLGRQSILSDDKLIGNWRINYQSGELKAVGYDSTGQIIASNTVNSFGNVSNLDVNIERPIFKSEKNSLLFVKIKAVDLNGNFVANANNFVNVTVTGAGDLVGMDNGNSVDTDQYITSTKRLFNGLLEVIIRPNDKEDNIKVQIVSPGLTDKTVELSKASLEILSETKGSQTSTEKGMSVPVRQVMLSAKNLNFDKNNQSQIVRATILPETHNQHIEVEWRITDEKGIPSDIASLKKLDDNLNVFVTAQSNGHGFIRCLIRNNSKYSEIISIREINIIDHHEHYIDPYKEVSGGVYTRSNVELTSGNERGVATLRGTQSNVIFDNVNFGKVGSDKITLSLFPLDDGAIPVEVWLGNPQDATGKFITKLDYTKGSIWNTYQEQEFQLPKRITGKQTFCLVFKQKVHMKFFKFYEINPVFEPMSILSADLKYGDSFKIEKNQIKNIGNNVTFVFTNLNMERGVNKVVIKGYAQSNNSIELKFTDNTGSEVTTMLDFQASSKIVEQSFSIPIIKNIGKLEFIFLPGSNFNFESFYFSKN